MSELATLPDDEAQWRDPIEVSEWDGWGRYVPRIELNHESIGDCGEGVRDRIELSASQLRAFLPIAQAWLDRQDREAAG